MAMPAHGVCMIRRDGVDKRHPADMTVRIGATRDGKLKGMTFRGTFNTGAAMAQSMVGRTLYTRPVNAAAPSATARSR